MNATKLLLLSMEGAVSPRNRAENLGMRRATSLARVRDPAEGDLEPCLLSLGGLGGRTRSGRGAPALGLVPSTLLTQITCLVCLSMRKGVRGGGGKGPWK